MKPPFILHPSAFILSAPGELSALVTANLQRATRLRQSILQQAFEGKLS